MELKAISIFLFSTVLCLSYGQLIIPNRPLGYFYSGTRDAPIHLDVHMCPLCPDSAASFPILKQVAEHYGPTNLTLVMHLFPLPFHHQAYLVTKGAEVVRKYGGGDSAAYEWLKYFYDDLILKGTFSNANTAGMTTNEVITALAEVAVGQGMQEDVFRQRMDNSDINRKTRAAWKYSCTRGVASTPTFFLNDIEVRSALSTWTKNEWIQVIDPLLNLPEETNKPPVSSAKKIVN
ncbi:hypothetical protein ACF0H5_017166 [Mactra antiquata]